MSKIVERVAEHYDTQEAAFGRTYIWCPECVVVECKCGKGHTASAREEVVIELWDEDYEPHHHPWRYWHPTEGSGIPV